MSETNKTTPTAPATARHPFRTAVLRGLAIIMPPLLTIVVFLWAWATIESYVLSPIESLARWGLTRNRLVLDSIPRSELSFDANGNPTYQRDGIEFVPVGQQWIPSEVFLTVKRNPGDRLPDTADAFYRRYVDIRYLRRSFVVPVFLCLFILVLYLLGKFVAAGVGRMLWNFCESLIHRLPLIRNVYSSVKQVTDFVFSEREIEYTRVVAVEYPRKGVWSIGFVTGESMLDIRSAANEPVLSVLMPTSPMPATGFTITVRKSETIDLNITIDQAIQFVISCGVAVPTLQQSVRSETAATVNAAVAARIVANGNGSKNGDEHDAAKRSPSDRDGTATN